jgi:hypothetical protein
LGLRATTEAHRESWTVLVASPARCADAFIVSSFGQFIV